MPPASPMQYRSRGAAVLGVPTQETTSVPGAGAGQGKAGQGSLEARGGS